MNRHPPRAKGTATFAVLLCGLAQAHSASVETPHHPSIEPAPTKGAQTMGNTTESPQPGSLEHFNRPENFLADTSNLDMEIIRKSEQIKHGGTEQFVRSDGVRVRIDAHKDRKTGATIYGVVLSWPTSSPRPSPGDSDSPFEYSSVYDANGILTGKSIEFYGVPFGVSYMFKDGQMVSKLPDGVELRHPLEKTRAAMLKELGIDLLDTSQVDSAWFTEDGKDGRPQMLAVEFKKGHTLALVDPETGKIIFESRPGEWMQDEKDPAYKGVENLVRKKVSKDALIYGIFRKVRAKGRNRFFEAFIRKPGQGELKSTYIELTAYLFDLKTGKILYQVDSSAAPVIVSPIPQIGLIDEYEQHLKMLEAEKH